MTEAVLVLAVLLSGASALLFETLWFRLCGLLLGNGVWASSLVLAAFMAGLALGNALAGRLAGRLLRPLRAYAGLELTIGASGYGLVLLLSALPPLLAPLLRGFLDFPQTLNAVRLTVAFGLMVVPAAAMGATLPTLVKALGSAPERFGPLLARLYGWNTLGAVAGALAGEGLLIERFGLRGTGLLACLLNLGAALLALAAARLARPFAPAATSEAPPPPRSRGALPLLAAAALCGGALLALEVVWFRFLALFVMPSGLVFAVLLAVVLAGIAGGSLLGGAWLRRQADADRFLPEAALLAGVLCVATYAGYATPGPQHPSGIGAVAWLAARLMLPVCLVSGLLFVLQGAALRRQAGEDARTAGWLTLANTLGAMLGALLAGFLLLPRLGMDRSLLALAASYGAVALLLAPQAARGGRTRARWILLAGASAAFLLALALFPAGFADRCIRVAAARYQEDGSTLVAVREGVLETAVYLRKDLWGEPLYHRLVTNGFTMSGSSLLGRRYMKLFAWWPLALRPDARSALLICFGVGSTAKALTDTGGLTSIDVVEISPEVLELSALAFPAESHPLRDRRVRVVVDDGRFFLMATDRRYDLITAEPPPPKAMGVVNLYSREYFQLVRDRLTEGGVATHWLPVYQLALPEFKAITRGFCDVFPDCTLWSGEGMELMLAGTRGLGRRADEADFVRQWRDAGSAEELRAVGFELPEQLGATFVADAAQIAAMIGSQPPLVDDFPLRLGPRLPRRTDPFYFDLLDTDAAHRRFEQSAFVRDLWPPALRARTLPFFDAQAILNRIVAAGHASRAARFEDLRRVLTGTPLRSLPLLLMGTEDLELKMAARAQARGDRDPAIPYLFGLQSLADRQYARAVTQLDGAEAAGAQVSGLAVARALACALAGDRAGAAERVRAAQARAPGDDAEVWAWLSRSFSLGLAPFPAGSALGLPQSR
jgi:predicted membrane-bound spermidine synthase